MGTSRLLSRQKLGCRSLWPALTLALVFGILSCGNAFAQEHSISIAGAEELVLAHTEMNCGRTPRGAGADVTDIPVTAFRRKDGSVVVLSSNQNNYYLEGPSVEQARRTSCANLIKPVNDVDPAKFTGRQWLFAIHAKSYDFVLGFIHNEYHGNDFHSEGCEKTSQSNFECWYGSTTLAVSRDGGFSFTAPSPPDNVLAALPFKFATGKKRAGAVGPKVVTNPNDGMTYVMITYVDRNRRIRAQECLLRGSGKEFNDWRAWDGQAFAMDMESPYAVERSGDCAAVLPYVVHSLKYVPAINRFVSLGWNGSRLVYAFSENLINWSRPQTLMTVTRKQIRRPDDLPARDYFSLLDPTSASINFDTLERKPYLYFVQYLDDRILGKSGRRRAHDVYRVPIVIK